MATTVLSDLKLMLQRAFYTIDDCFADASILDWKRYRADVEEEFAPLVAAVGKSKNWVELVQKYYQSVLLPAESSMNADDFAIEKEAFVYIETLLKLVTKAKTAALDEDAPAPVPMDYIVRAQPAPKLWKKVLTDLLNEQIPPIVGALVQAKKKTALFPVLERGAVDFDMDLLMATLMALKKNAVKAEYTLIGKDEVVYIPLTSGVLAKCTFREKGRIVSEFNTHTAAVDGEESKPVLELFVQHTQQAKSEQLLRVHDQLSVRVMQNLYILYDKYVIELEFKAASVLL